MLPDNAPTRVSTRFARKSAGGKSGTTYDSIALRKAVNPFMGEAVLQQKLQELPPANRYLLLCRGKILVRSDSSPNFLLQSVAEFLAD